jgi:hypothetical protein
LRLLLDTHVALWAITGDARLPETIQAMIADPANSISVSAASVWEIAIKHALGRGGPGAMPIGGAQASAYFRASDPCRPVRPPAGRPGRARGDEPGDA